ncbi:glycyl-radical enzyme activating protein [Bacteroides thetaiotaomicron]|nr:glycyl-radical enzyme activating protein [Bacteroides thetaiotaomicron]
MKGFITNIQRMSIHDGPGIRSTIFLKGCNLRCKWCHNPETWSMKPQLQYIEDKCIHCFSCITVCEYEVLSIDSNRLSIHRERCTDCGKCTERCTSGALAWIGKEVDSSDIIHEILQDLIYYQKSGGGITLSGVNLCSKKILR